MKQLDNLRIEFETHLKKHLRELERDRIAIAPRLLSAITYSLANGGKRIRALLVLAGCQIADGDSEAAKLVAIAIESIHAYSLIHDDLPALDNDELRRGKPSCHIAHGEDMAILAGDALQSLAFNTLLQLPNQLGNKHLVQKWIIDASLDMVAGQALDIRADMETSSPQELDLIYNNKTGALIRASLVAGVLCGSPDDKKIRVVENIGQLLGLAFQVADDLLEVSQSTSALGKSNTSDLRNNKPVYHAIHGIEKAREVINSCHQRARDNIACLPEESTVLLRELCDYLLKRED